ncbi:MAG: SprB repeat-containing protein, partial [Bacteroidales bacterium]|nr:SprB repeat-containing protein [Bacteroidales bacterium]
MKTIDIKKLIMCCLLLVWGITINLNAQDYTIETYATFNRGSNSLSSKCSNFCKVTAVLQNNSEIVLWDYSLQSLPENTTWTTTRYYNFSYSNKIVKLKIETRRTWANWFGNNCVDSDAYKGYCEIPISFYGGNYEKNCLSNYKDSQNRDLYSGYSGVFQIKIYPKSINLDCNTSILPDKHKIKIKAKENYPSSSFIWEYQIGSIQKVQDKWVPYYIPKSAGSGSGSGQHQIIDADTPDSKLQSGCVPYDYTSDNCAYCYSSVRLGNCYDNGGYWLYKDEFVGGTWTEITAGKGNSELELCGNDLLSNFVTDVVKNKKQIRIRINYGFSKTSSILVLDGMKSSPTFTGYTVNSNLCNGEQSASVKLTFSEALLKNESLNIGVNGIFSESYANITSLDSDNSYTISNLAAGEYSFTLLGKYPYSSTNTASNIYATYTDAAAHSIKVKIEDPPKLTFDKSSINDILCNGGSDGKISVNIYGGTSPYNVYCSENTTNTATSAPYTISGLPAGAYTVHIRDENNCFPKETDGQEKTISVTLTQPTQLK